MQKRNNRLVHKIFVKEQHSNLPAELRASSTLKRSVTFTCNQREAYLLLTSHVELTSAVSLRDCAQADGFESGRDVRAGHGFPRERGSKAIWIFTDAQVHEIIYAVHRCLCISLSTG